LQGELAGKTVQAKTGRVVLGWGEFDTNFSVRDGSGGSGAQNKVWNQGSEQKKHKREKKKDIS